MSSYYAAYYGSALVLKEKEFEEMTRMYIEKIVHKLTVTKKKDFYDMLEEKDCALSEYPFICSKCAKGDPNKILDATGQECIFDVVEISQNDADGMYLNPYLNSGELTWNANCGIDLRGENLYVVFSDKQLDSPHSFLTKPYDSYDEFVNEFKEKLEDYLPADFDWNAHIGSFSYACYA